jgi:hypothetical protein
MYKRTGNRSTGRSAITDAANKSPHSSTDFSHDYQGAYFIALLSHLHVCVARSIQLALRQRTRVSPALWMAYEDL